MISDITGTYIVDSQDALHVLAQRVVDSVEAGDVLLLVGELGSGKTAFVKELAQVLQVGEVVTSPTFTVAAEYDVPHSHVLDQLVHVDLYRLGEGAMGVIGVEDMHVVGEMLMMAQQLRRLVVIEWANKLPTQVEDGHWRARAWQMEFRYGDHEHERVVEIRKVEH